jgi:Transposase DDE domain
MLPAPFLPFVKDSPFCVMTRAALESLFSAEHLDELFRTTAEKQYTRELLFSQLVELMTAVVLQQQPSVLAAYRKRIGNITVSDQSVYNKLDGMELGVSAALVHDSALRIAPVIDELQARQASWLPGFRIRILDGNHLSATERRLLPLRDAWDSPLPGKVLAVLDQQTGLATDVFLTPDGHAQERSLLDDILAAIKARDLWIADRNFCTLKFLFMIHLAKAAFVIRQHGNVEGRLVGKKRYIGRTDTGEVYEQNIELCYDGRVKKFRRVSIVLDKPTRDGDTEIHILTNLPKKKATAIVVAELYRRRWTIEGLFLEMAETLNAEPQTLAYPKAALFAFCLALLASNAVAMLKAAVRAEHGQEAVESLSVYYAALDVQQTHRGMMIALPAPQWELFRRMNTVELAAAMREMARAIDMPRYRKSTRGPKKHVERKVYTNGGHVSTHKRLQEWQT